MMVDKPTTQHMTNRCQDADQYFSKLLPVKGVPANRAGPIRVGLEFISGSEKANIFSVLSNPV